MVELKLRIDKTLDFVDPNEIKLFESEAALLQNKIYDKKGAGNDFLGWVNLPAETDDALIADIEETAARIKAQSKVVVVVGIGGSYLGARAVIDALSSNFYQMQYQQADNPMVVYAGQNLSEDYMAELLHFLDDKDYSIIIISKSGTTTEPAIAFRLLRAHLEKKVGEQNAGERIYAITDAQRGALKTLATEKGYKSYVIADDVGGRYSVLTPVGLLPIAVAGFDIRKLVKGARAMQEHLQQEKELLKNPAALYAVVRNMLYRKGKTTEIMASYTPNLMYMVEWWKQLYGESEGKEQKGIFPAGVNFTADLHSMGQYIQDGMRNIFETVIRVENPRYIMEIPHDSNDLDGLNFLAGKRMSYVNKMAEEGTMLAHLDGQVPNLEIILPRIDESVLGELIYFFEMGCAISGYMLEVNPFDQPGVEAYKKNMFALLEKPGFEKETAEIKKRIS
ncbi:MAG: glucose-6-phosphate isomerase [Bacteroidetes bacterium]|nr:MAG: glucose-6-phosphate isomerase [Bacteroidota bacterium]